MTQMPAWTYSQLDAFETCPRQFYHLKVARDVADPPGPHAEWGVKVHSAFEDWITKKQPLPDGMTQWQPIADKIANLPGSKMCEQRLALDKDFRPTDWRGAWTRGIVDLLAVKGKSAATLDYKTGKRKPSEQLDLYAAYTFSYYPEVQTVTTMYVWLKERKVDRKTVHREELSVVWQSMLPRVRKLEAAYERDKWPARPSGLCRGWCPCTGCEFNSNRGK